MSESFSREALSMEEWVVAIINGRHEGDVVPRDMVAIAPVSVLDSRSWITICEDQTEAQRVAEIHAGLGAGLF